LEEYVASQIAWFIAYYRVSTTKQGQSGLGIEAQRSAIAAYVRDHGSVAAEFTEIESGKQNDRPALEQALSLGRVRRIPIVVAKVDRLTRSVGFLSRLLESGVDVRFADLPAIEGPTGRFILQQMAAVAELEAGLISSRTKAALAAAKVRGIKLGGHRGAALSPKARQASIAARAKSANQRAKDLMPIIRELQAAGITTNEGIAAALTTKAIPTARGATTWTGTQVARVRFRMSVSKDVEQH
jgi:DNA invertase Pin-like site-specific DNA recombinase